jgi:hypothetical protein
MNPTWTVVMIDVEGAFLHRFEEGEELYIEVWMALKNGIQAM